MLLRPPGNYPKEDYTQLEKMLQEMVDPADIIKELRRQVERKLDYSEQNMRWYIATELFDRAVRARHDGVVNDIAISVRLAYWGRGKLELFSPVLDALVDEDFDTVRWFVDSVRTKQLFTDAGLNPEPRNENDAEISPLQYALLKDRTDMLQLLFPKLKPNLEMVQLAIDHHAERCVDFLMTMDVVKDDDDANERLLHRKILYRAARSKLSILQNVTQKIFEGRNRSPGDLGPIPDALTCCIRKVAKYTYDKEYSYPVPADLPNKLDLLMKYGAVASLPDSYNKLPIELMLSDEILIPRDPLHNFDHQQHYADVITTCCQTLLDKMKAEHEEERDISTLLHHLKMAPAKNPTAKVVQAETPKNNPDHGLDHEQEQQPEAREASQAPHLEGETGQNQKDHTLGVVPIEIYLRVQDTVIKNVIHYDRFGRNHEKST